MKDYKVKVWENKKLKARISVDTETTLAPFYTRDHRMVTCQVYDGSDIVYFVKKQHVRRFLNLHKDHHLIMQNAPFDVGVLSKIVGMDILFSFYDRNLIWDTKILYKLLKLAETGTAPRQSSLKLICQEMLNREIDKNTEVRTTFEQFENTAVEDIPEAHLKYAAEDAIHTYDAFLALRSAISEHDKYGTFLTHHIQVKGDLALDCIYKNGLGFDQSAAKARLSELELDLSTIRQRLATWGYVQGRAGISEQYERIVKQLGIYEQLPKSEKTGKPSQKANDLQQYSNLPFISDYLEFDKKYKLTTFLRDIKEDVVHGRFNPILNTGRVSMSAPNIQQLPRSGGIRECFVPKDRSKVFVDADYSAIELVALSEVIRRLYGKSEMGDLINAGEDLHIATATSVYNKPADQITKDERQFAKIPNFAFPTNMAPRTFVDYCKPMGIDITEDEADEVKQAWLRRYPELDIYFNEPRRHVDGRSEWGKDTYCHYTLTGRKRAYSTYTAYLNTHFQGLAADGCKLAIYECMKAGLHMVLVLHDQIMVEAHAEEATAVQNKLESCMIKGMGQVIKDTKISVESQIIERFSK